MMLKKLADSGSALSSSVASWLKVALMSRRPASRVKRGEAEEIVVLGNGPSLRHTLDTDMPSLMKRSRMAVNFAANAPEFALLRPDFYVMADPHFFNIANQNAADPNVLRLWDALRRVDWPMVLYVPCKRVKMAEACVAGSSVSVKGFNLTPAEGLSPLVYPVYNMGLGMPRPRNVLIPSIMIAIREGFKTIYIAGADHTWSRTLGVDDQNRVVSVQPHFYKDNAKEHARVAQEYAGYRLHDILKSLYIAFRSYHIIKRYARSKGISIYNISPGSFIDAFPRLEALPR